MQTVETQDIENLLSNVHGIRGRHTRESRSLIILLYLTGCRPVEALDVKGKDFSREGAYIKVMIRGAKHGLTRVIFLQFKNKLVKELYAYAIGLFPDMYIFFHHRSNRIRSYVAKAGPREYIITTDHLYYLFKKWTDGSLDITPYFLRHNRFSKLAMAGAMDTEIRLTKGSKTTSSIIPYQHMSARSAKKTAKMID